MVTEIELFVRMWSTLYNFRTKETKNEWKVMCHTATSLNDPFLGYIALKSSFGGGWYCMININIFLTKAKEKILVIVAVQL